MRETRVTFPELALVAGTRAALGAGVGLLLADRLNADQRRAVGWTLLLIGAITTLPLAFEVFGKSGPSARTDQAEQERGGLRFEADDRLQRSTVAPT
jgi:uncharacterized membrane protein YfcA